MRLGDTLEKRLGFKTLFCPDVYRVVLRLYDCSELYLEIPEMIMMVLLVLLKTRCTED